jgi:SAM-dependent methyltransferase
VGIVTAPDPLDRTRHDYDRVAAAYDDMVRTDRSVAATLAKSMITAFAELVSSGGVAGEVLDAGCGPGHWTDHLDRLGVRTIGIDLSPEMIAIARRRRPDLAFRVGSLLDPDVGDGSTAGVLAHYSLIHLPPDLLPAAIAGFARVLAPTAPLLLGAQIADDLPAPGWRPYDHRASPAFVWTLDALAAELHRHGFDEAARLRVAPTADGKPAGGYLLARRR